MKHLLLRAALLMPLIAVAACNTTTADLSTTESITGLNSSSNTVGGTRPQRGHASWYGPGFHGRQTASGETFHAGAMTAAHRTLPFGTRVRVVHEGTGRSIVVRINDRGPFHRGRIIDLAQAPARSLGLMASGAAFVSLHRID